MDLSTDKWKDHICQHSGTTLMVALEDAARCAGTPVEDSDLRVHASILASGSAMSSGVHGFMARPDNPEGIE
jgi:hypothetical protein